MPAYCHNQWTDKNNVTERNTTHQQLQYSSAHIKCSDDIRVIALHPTT
jgi:hypothetical protein